MNRTTQELALHLLASLNVADASEFQVLQTVLEDNLPLFNQVMDAIRDLRAAKEAAWQLFGYLEVS